MTDLSQLIEPDYKQDAIDRKPSARFNSDAYVQCEDNRHRIVGFFSKMNFFKLFTDSLFPIILLIVLGLYFSVQFKFTFVNKTINF